jgi:hypothetical protein
MQARADALGSTEKEQTGGERAARAVLEKATYFGIQPG